jgi:hypothetical protein
VNQTSETRSRFLELAGKVIERLEGVPGAFPDLRADSNTVETAAVELRSGGMSARMMHCMAEDFRRLLVLECVLGTVIAKDRGAFLKSLLAFNLESWPRVLGLDAESGAVTCTWTFQLSETSAQNIAAHCEEAASLAAEWQDDGFLAPALRALPLPH